MHATYPWRAEQVRHHRRFVTGRMFMWISRFPFEPRSNWMADSSVADRETIGEFDLRSL